MSLIKKSLLAASLLVSSAFSQTGFAQTFDVEKDFLVVVKNFVQPIGSSGQIRVSTAMPGNIIKKNSLPQGKHTALIPDYSEEKGLTFNFYYDNVALKNPRLLISDFLFWVALGNNGSRLPRSGAVLTGSYNYDVQPKLLEAHVMAELLNNANAGSPTAKARLFELQARAITFMHFDPTLLSNMGLPADAQETSMLELAQEITNQVQEGKNYLRRQNKELENWKKETQLLDRIEKLPQKLNDFVLKNDRKSVRKLLEAYLPWPIMEPTEISMWKTWLEAIEHPNKNDTVVAFRGVDYDTDKVQRLQTPQGEKLGFFSSVLTKNQGNYSRRLRSLTTNRLKNGDYRTLPNELPSISVMQQFQNHANEPTASNFMSFTLDYSVITDFIGDDITNPKTGETRPGGGLLAEKMDRRRMIPNLASPLPHEVELLVPLIIFPDEVVAYNEGHLDGEKLQDFADLVLKKTGVDISAPNTGNDYYRKLGARFLREVTPSHNISSCSHIFM